MRVRTWFKRVSIILLLLGILQMLVEGIKITRSIATYWRELRGTQEKYDGIAEAVARRFAADRNLPDVSRPDIRVIPDGPDLKVEAGYLRIQSASGPSQQGSEYGAMISEYTPGGYRINAAPNAYVVIDALTAGMNEFLADKIKGHKVEAEVLGNADGLPIKSSYKYSGDLGVISGAPYYSYNSQRIETMNLLPGTPHTNDSIAFLRALDVLSIVSRSPYLATANAGISTYVDSRVGGAYRNVILRVTIKNALAEEYNEIPPILRDFVVPDRSDS